MAYKNMEKVCQHSPLHISSQFYDQGGSLTPTIQETAAKSAQKSLQDAIDL